MADTLTIDEFMALVASDDWTQETGYEITEDNRLMLDDDSGDIGGVEGVAWCKSTLGYLTIYYYETYGHDDVQEPMETLWHVPDREQTWFISHHITGDDGEPMDDDEVGRMLPDWFQQIDWGHVCLMEDA